MDISLLNYSIPTFSVDFRTKKKTPEKSDTKKKGFISRVRISGRPVDPFIVYRLIYSSVCDGPNLISKYRKLSTCILLKYVRFSSRDSLVF
ncbi:hypothetical protein TCA2_3321 [Paenibacillus sp. TCA20]|nr:hypothetical protein TCA2_3321 [Paenibacillus sp. TCA20]